MESSSLETRSEIRIVHDPEELGLSSVRLENAFNIVRAAVNSGKVMGGAIQISCKNVALEAKVFGRRRLTESTPVEPNTIFLTASVTKPITSTAAMLLVERGSVGLDDPVSSIIPEFGDGGIRDRILVRHLLTHTSGLPDQLPENRELRSQHASLDEFILRTYKTPILFEPGTNISYQSAGMTMLMDIVQHATGMKLAEFARKEIFEPLGMKDTSYGVNWNKAERVSQVNVPHDSFQYGEADAADWNWNSSYWWNLGSPWGGVQSTTGDLIKFLNMFLNNGTLGDCQLLSHSTVRAMTSNQVQSLITIPAEIKHNDPWGLGWQLKSPLNSRFGDICSSDTFGHGGATGCLVWADPLTSLACVILTNQPLEQIEALLSKFSNAVVGSMVG